jgi:hypothetical protein
MQVVKAGALYFVVVFAVGFVLGAIRTLWVVPRARENSRTDGDTHHARGHYCGG